MSEQVYSGEPGEATEIVHWPGKDVPCCEKHAAQLKHVGAIMGFAVSPTPWPAGGVCQNCVNEFAKRAGAEGGR